MMCLVIGFWLQYNNDACVLSLPWVLPSEREEGGSACPNDCWLWKAASAQVAAGREGGEGGLQGRWRLRVSREQEGADMWLGLERVERKRFFCWGSSRNVWNLS